MTMAEVKGNTAVPQNGDRDRVAMLSLRTDGTPDQTNPEIIGDKDFALEATKEQFRQQAVSAVDQAKRPEIFGTPDGGEALEQDPKIAELKDAHDSAADAADKAAESTVNALFNDEPAVDAKPAPKPARPSATGK
jgi:hypothetical protein